MNSTNQNDRLLAFKSALDEHIPRFVENGGKLIYSLFIYESGCCALNAVLKSKGFEAKTRLRSILTSLRLNCGLVLKPTDVEDFIKGFDGQYSELSNSSDFYLLGVETRNKYKPKHFSDL